jgi:hypothetical protein
MESGIVGSILELRRENLAVSDTYKSFPFQLTGQVFFDLALCFPEIDTLDLFIEFFDVCVFGVLLEIVEGFDDFD